MSDKVVFLVDKLTDEFNQVFPSGVREALAQELDVQSVPIIQSADLRDSDCHFEDVESIFSTWNMPAMDEDIISRVFPKLRHLYYAAGTVKYFSRPFERCGVQIHSAAPVNAIPVAEYSAALIILAAKGFFRSRISISNHFFRAKKAAESFPGNFHSLVGILGFGNVGRRVASLLHEQTELEIVTYDPYVEEEDCISFGVQKVPLSDLFETSDVITNHLPNTEETKGMISADLMSLMKPTATLINTGRGAQVNEADLARQLARQPLQTAILDVTDPEPVRPWNRLLRCKNAYVTPHIAGSQGGEKRRLGMAMIEEFRRVMRGECPQYSVNLASLNRGA